jgi:hypothetical protein
MTGDWRSSTSLTDPSMFQSASGTPLALRMFPKVFPLGMKTAPGVISGGHFRW